MKKDVLAIKTFFICFLKEPTIFINFTISCTSSHLIISHFAQPYKCYFTLDMLRFIHIIKQILLRHICSFNKL